MTKEDLMFVGLDQINKRKLNNITKKFPKDCIYFVLFRVKNNRYWTKKD